MPSVLISRFYLNLHELQQQELPERRETSRQQVRDPTSYITLPRVDMPYYSLIQIHINKYHYNKKAEDYQTSHVSEDFVYDNGRNRLAANIV